MPRSPWGQGSWPPYSLLAGLFRCRRPSLWPTSERTVQTAQQRLTAVVSRCWRVRRGGPPYARITEQLWSRQPGASPCHSSTVTFLVVITEEYIHGLRFFTAGLTSRL